MNLLQDCSTFKLYLRSTSHSDNANYYSRNIQNNTRKYESNENVSQDRMFTSDTDMQMGNEKLGIRYHFGISFYFIIE